MTMNKALFFTYMCLLIYIVLSSGVILYNKWVLSPKYFNFPFPITLTMIHMGFSGLVAFFLVRVFKVVSPLKITFEIYVTCVIPISAFFASSLWFGNTAYLHISVAFIQMLKALMPVATFLVVVVCGTDRLRCDVFPDMVLVSVGVVISSYGEIHFNVVGTAYQVIGIVAEALRLVLTQLFLQKKGLTLNPISSLYYIAPCRNGDLTYPVKLLDIFLECVVRTSIKFLNILSDRQNWSSYNLSCRGAEELDLDCTFNNFISGINYYKAKYCVITAALCGVVVYNYIKVKDVRASSLLSVETMPEKLTKEWKLEKRLSDFETGNRGCNGTSGNISALDPNADEEAPFIPASARMSHLERSQFSSHNS